MVYRTCLRLVGNVHDAEDATQAVFLLLARQPKKAQGSLAGWLHKVGHDVAISLLRSKSRRARREEKVAMRQPTTSSSEVETLRQELDSGIARLPTRLREPVILCYLEGRRQEEAARILGCNQGTLSRRASDGINLLRSLLQRRGVVVGSAALIAFLGQQQAHAAAVPAALLGSLKLAAAAQPVGAGGLSVQAGALADSMIRAGALAQAKAAAIVLVAGTAIGLGTAALVSGIFSAKPASSMVLVNFDSSALPVNKFGELYPRCDPPGEQGDDGGVFGSRINSADAVSGSSLQMRLTEGRWKAQFAPDDKAGKKRFAREYCADPGGWRFNIYKRLRFWIKLPAGSTHHFTDGRTNVGVGAYVRRVNNVNLSSLNEGGGSYTHWVNVPVGRWVQVIVNMHPDHQWGDAIGKDVGNVPHPTGEAGYNYFDALTQFSIEARAQPSSYPADYLLDEIEFVHQPNSENDGQIYSLTATYDRTDNRLIVTWNRPSGEDAVRHEVRYAFTDIHGIGWAQAVPAPAGIVTPPGKGRGYNGMVYDTTELPLSQQTIVFIAVKPENANVFSQIAVPLTLK
jgi:RNA polymerase sigma factor (sigma-70 family)